MFILCAEECKDVSFNWTELEHANNYPHLDKENIISTLGVLKVQVSNSISFLLIEKQTVDSVNYKYIQDSKAGSCGTDYNHVRFDLSCLFI